MSSSIPKPIDIDSVGLPALLDEQLGQFQREIDTMRREIATLRQRDEVLNRSMRRIDEELRLAAKLQQDFLPKSLPQIGAVRFHTLFRPAGYVSGDLYDVWRLDEKHVGFYISDAVGHGMPAALLTMFIKNALLTKRVTESTYCLLDPAEVLAELNRAMLAQGLSRSTFATAIYGLIDTETLTLRYARAGHPFPLLIRGGQITSLESEGGLLGIFPEERYPSSQITLQPGDRLALFSDGIETALAEHYTASDPEAWKSQIQSRATLPAVHLMHELAGILDAQEFDAGTRDDLTMVVVEAI